MILLLLGSGEETDSGIRILAVGIAGCVACISFHGVPQSGYSTPL
jgi:hypothetical protein